MHWTRWVIAKNSPIFTFMALDQQRLFWMSVCGEGDCFIHYFNMPDIISQIEMTRDAFQKHKDLLKENINLTVKKIIMSLCVCVLETCWWSARFRRFRAWHKKCFLVPVPSRGSDVLLDIIKHWIWPGTIVVLYCPITLLSGSVYTANWKAQWNLRCSK